MKHIFSLLVLFNTVSGFCQSLNIAGTYTNTITGISVTFKEDFTFQYIACGVNPFFHRWEELSEKGNWILKADTIILNPGLPQKTYIDYDFREEKIANDTNLSITFNHIKRYFDANGNLVSADTLQIDRLDYAFNEITKKNLVRVSPYKTTHCTFAGYIPTEIITADPTISVRKPGDVIANIFIGCYELQGMKKFAVNDSSSNHFTFNVYSNYYQDGQIRQMKFLVKNENVLYTKQKENGEFEKDNFFTNTDTKLKKQKTGS
jgi:hypothetical protein